MADRTCSIEGCSTDGRLTLKMCAKHYRRWRTTGTTDLIPTKPKPRRAPIACSVQDCDIRVKAHGMCRRHYERWHAHGDPLAPRKAMKRIPIEERFWPKVDKSGPAPGHRPDLGPCWTWLGSKDGNGYGLLATGGGRCKRAHRISWEMAGRPDLIDGMHLDHLCRVRHCVRPDHLEQVTPAVNILRGVGAGATNAVKTHCPQGHEYTEANTYRWSNAPTVSRQCRTCLRGRSLAA